MKWSFTLLIIIQCLTCLTAQNTEAPEGEATLGQISHHSFCGPIPDKPLEQRKKDAKRFIAWYQPRKARPKAPPKTIPVVFHLLEDVPTITNEAVVNAVASLNNAYTHSQKYPNGADFSIGTRGVDTQIEFCLAQRAPDGGITNGIVRWETDYARMDVDLEDAKLKTQGQWDPRRYLNIWIVSEGLDVETDQDYSGRTSWTREANLGGYSGGPGGVVGPDARQDGVIAVGLGAALLAHENGHYLSLPHTFSATCANNDCLVDGDGICDTPPDISQAGCNQNTCSSDTLSNYSNGFFPTDVPDMTSNFMDYSSCPNEFTQGQADKMHFVLDNFRIDLPVEAPSSNPACNRPCDADFSVSFDINERYRETNVPYNFTSSVLGTVTVDSFAWHVERLGHPGLDYTIAWLEGFVPSAPAVATTPNLQHTFSEPGKYRVYLRAWNSADPDCYASYSRVVRVTCLGIDARFTPNVRFIAAKQPSGKMVDSVLFINRSINATSYEWTVRHEPYDNMAPAQPLFTSDSVDLNHTFLEPGDYFITLIAKNGPACQDTMGPFRLPVDDPTIDGVIRINQVDCYREDSIRVAFEISNNGYDTIRVGMPVTFYDEDPRNANPVPTVLGTYYLDRVVYGRDRAENFVAIVPASKPKLDQIWAAFNVLGNESIPITWPTPDLNVMSVNSEFPPTGANELNYRNNFASRRDFQFRVDLSMVEDVACKFTDVQLQADHRNGRDLNGVEWVPDDRLSCTDCLTPTLSLLDVDHVQDVILTSEYFCKDTASLSISVIKDDIPLPTVNNPTDFCRQDNQVEVANFVSGQQLSWYDVPTGSSGRPTPPAMPLNTPGTFNHWISQTINGCEGPRANFTFTVLELPDPPTVGNIPNVCEGEAPPDLATFVVGNNITWYSQETGGTGSSQPVGVATDQAGTFQYWVSTVGSECESERVQVAYTVISETVPPPVPAPMTICFGDTPPDLNSLTPGTDLRWYQSDTGGTGATSAPLVDTRQPGTFSHWVSQTSGNCESPRAELSYTILPEIPVPSIINPTDQCLGDTPIDLTTLVSGQQLRWYASQDTLDGTDTPPLASTDSAGTFTLWVSQVQSNCESERRPLSYTINPIPANPTASDLQNICAGNTLPNFNGSVAGSNLRWYANEAMGPGSATPPAPNANAPGIYTYWVSQTVLGCESERSEVSLTIDPLPPSPNISALPNLCIGSIAPDLDLLVSGTDLRWYDGPNGGMGSSLIPVLPTDITGSNSIWVSQTVNNCEGPRAELVYEVLPLSAPPQIAAAIPDICVGDQVPELGAAVAGTNLQWYQEPSGGNGNGLVPTISSATAQDYSFWVSQNENSCESERVALNFQVKETPEAPLLTADLLACVGEEAPRVTEFVLGENLSWYPDATNSEGSNSPPTISTETPGYYPLWISQTIAGCESPRTELVASVIGIDIIPFGPYLIPEGSSEQIEAEVIVEPTGVPYSISWLDPTGLLIDNDANLLDISPSEDGIYTISVNSATCNEEADVAVEIIYDVQVTQLFSPNNDGMNDFWHIGAIQRFPEARVDVFNRWGDKVHQAQPYENNWNGTDPQGRQLPMGTYYFVIELNDNNREPITGSVTIKY